MRQNDNHIRHLPSNFQIFHRLPCRFDILVIVPADEPFSWIITLPVMTAITR